MYEAADASYDELAERMRTLGGHAAIVPEELSSSGLKMVRRRCCYRCRVLRPLPRELDTKRIAA